MTPSASLTGVTPSVSLPGVLGIAAGSSLLVGLVGGVLLYAARKRSTGAIISLTAGIAVLCVAAGVLAATTQMFFTNHDLLVLAAVVATSGVVSTSVAVLLGRRIMAAGQALRDATQSFGGGQPLTLPDAPTAELAALSEDLRAAHERLADARRREQSLETSRRELVAWVSHDLRTPLAEVRAMAEALEDGVVADAETVSRYQQAIRAAADRLSSMVDDLFELASIHAGALRLSPTPVDFRDVISDTVASVEPLARAASVYVRGDVPNALAVEMDVAAVGRVLDNLLSNAIRMTPAHGVVTIEAHGNDGAVTVMVTDQCGGIAPPELDRLFEVGYRGSQSRNNDGGGAGLGLAITQGIVEASGGRISVMNRNGGCRFTVRLPASPSMPPPTTALEAVSDT